MSNNTKPLGILLYGVLVYDLLETLQRKLTTPAVITRLKENVAPDVLAAHMSRADVVIALKYSGMPPAPNLRLLQIPGAGMDQINSPKCRHKRACVTLTAMMSRAGNTSSWRCWRGVMNSSQRMNPCGPEAQKHRAPTAMLTALWNL